MSEITLCFESQVKFSFDTCAVCSFYAKSDQFTCSLMTFLTPVHTQISMCAPIDTEWSPKCCLDSILSTYWFADYPIIIMLTVYKQTWHFKLKTPTANDSWCQIIIFILNSLCIVLSWCCYLPRRGAFILYLICKKCKHVWDFPMPLT